MGIPCAHQIHQAREEGTKFSLSDFHPQWHTKAIHEVSVLVLMTCFSLSSYVAQISHSDHPYFARMNSSLMKNPLKNPISPPKKKTPKINGTIVQQV
jgi:hypothetical protein